MFDNVEEEMEASVASLRIAAARGRPVATADTRLVDVPGALGGLFPDGGIRRGSTVALGPASGGLSVALTLVGAVTGRDGWAAAVGLPHLGLVAAAELGVRLERLALVPSPGEQWPVVVAALVDGFDLLLLHPPVRVRATDARRLSARVRERGTVMVVLGAAWPEPPDLRLAVSRSDWDGLGAGNGYLRSRRAEVVLTGRRAAGRERSCSIWLPGAEGEVTLDNRVPPTQVEDPAPAIEVAG